MANGAEVARCLRAWMKSRFESVNSFAKALNVSQPTASQYLTGKRTPGNEMQARLRVLGCDIEWLMTGKERSEAEYKSAEELSKENKILREQLEVFKKENNLLRGSFAPHLLAAILEERGGRRGKK